MNKYSFEMFYDYYRGCSQRELERKYNCSMRTITSYCKKIMTYLFNNKNSIIGGNIGIIEKEINNIVVLHSYE